MTTEEQNALHAEYLKGSTKARDALLAMCERDINGMVRKLKAPRHLVADMLQEARVAILASALPKFKASQGLQFRFYAALWAREAIRRCAVTNSSMVKSHKRGRGGDLSLNAPVSDEHDSDEHINYLESDVDLEAQAIAAQEAAVLRLVMERVISRLKSTGSGQFDKRALCRDVVYSRLLAHEPANLEDVANRHGVARETVRKAEEAILRLARSFILNAAEAA